MNLQLALFRNTNDAEMALVLQGRDVHEELGRINSSSYGLLTIQFPLGVGEAEVYPMVYMVLIDQAVAIGISWIVSTGDDIKLEFC